MLKGGDDMDAKKELTPEETIEEQKKQIDGLTRALAQAKEDAEKKKLSHQQRLQDLDDQMHALYKDKAMAENLVKEMGNWKKQALLAKDTIVKLQDRVSQMERDIQEQRRHKENYFRILQQVTFIRYARDFRARRAIKCLHGRITETMRGLMKVEEQALKSPNPHIDAQPVFAGTSDVGQQSEIQVWYAEARRLHRSKHRESAGFLRNLLDIEHIIHTSIREVQRHKDHYRELADRFFERSNRLQKENGDAKKLVEELREEIAALKAHTKELEQRLEESRDKLEDKGHELARMRRERDRAEHARQHVKKQLMDARAALDLLDVKMHSAAFLEQRTMQAEHRSRMGSPQRWSPSPPVDRSERPATAASSADVLDVRAMNHEEKLPRPPGTAPPRGHRANGVLSASSRPHTPHRGPHGGLGTFPSIPKGLATKKHTSPYVFRLAFVESAQKKPKHLHASFPSPRKAKSPRRKKAGRTRRRKANRKHPGTAPVLSAVASRNANGADSGTANRDFAKRVQAERLRWASKYTGQTYLDEIRSVKPLQLSKMEMPPQITELDNDQT